MPILVSFLSGFLPMLFFAWIMYWLDRYEKEPKLLLGAVFLWGAIFAAGSAFIINTILGLGIFLFTSSEIATDFASGSLIAPFVEEILKGLAVLTVFLVFRREFDSILDGIIYASVTALGFAATENTYYIYAYGFHENGWIGIWSMFFVRVFLVGWQHPFYTSFTGIGLAISRMKRVHWQKITAPLVGFSLAVFSHSLHNTFSTLFPGLPGLSIGAVFDWIGWMVMFCFILWVIQKEKLNLVTYLKDEVSQGTISTGHYQTAISASSQSSARFKAIFKGTFKKTHRFYSLCGELAHKKNQFAKMGDEDGNGRIIKDLQLELAKLGPLI